MHNEIKNDEKRHIIGLVVFDGERFLLLHRKLNWSGWEFAKGAIEDDESEDDAIRRELFEETGIKKYKVTTKLDEFNYFDDKRGVNSLISNYLLHVSSNSKVKLNNPHQLDGEIVLEHDDFRWFHPENVVNMLTHKNHKETMVKAIKYLGLNVE